MCPIIIYPLEKENIGKYKSFKVIFLGLLNGCDKDVFISLVLSWMFNFYLSVREEIDVEIHMTVFFLSDI